MRAIVLLLVATLCCGSANALVPHEINYQGYLTNPGGTPVNASVTMTLNLYNVAMGGTALYTEQQTVTVTNGVFNVLIGPQQAAQFLLLAFDVPYYLGIMVAPDAEMTPRRPIAASAYAIRSASTESLAPGATVPASQVTGTIGSTTSFTGNLAGDVTGTQSATVVATVAGTTAANVAAGANLANAATSVNTANTIVKRDASGNFAAGAITGSSLSLVGGSPPAPRLDVSGSGWFRGEGGALPASAAKGVRVFYDTGLGVGSVFAFDYGSGPLNLMLQQPGGNVGIGTPSPGSKLTVAGTVESTAGGVKYPDGNTQTKALANCSAEGDVAVMHLGMWACRSTLGYVDNGDGTVTDNNTGLIWEKKQDCGVGGGVADLTNPHCRGNTYSWSAASPFTDPTGTLYSDFAPKLNGLNESNLSGGGSCFAGHCDWRIPTVGELRTILASCPGGGALCINAIFGPTQTFLYWSSSSLVSSPDLVWVVYFDTDGVSFGEKNGGGNARAVRSGR